MIGNGKHVLIVAPFWETNRFHPHLRRIDQWVSVLHGCGFKITLAALGSKPGRWSFDRYDVVTDHHPRFVGNQRKVLIAKSDLQHQQIKRRMQRLVGQVLRERAIIASIACHPSVALVTRRWIPTENTIVDLPDIPSQPSVSEDQVDPCDKSIAALLEDKWVTVLSHDEKRQLGQHGVPSERIIEAGPLLQGCVDPTCSRPYEICIFGRASTSAFDEMLVTLVDYMPRQFRRWMSLKVVVCGEMARSLRSTRDVHVLGPAADLRNLLARRICILPPPVTGTGVSFRVLDIVEAGAFLVAASQAVRGYGFEAGHHYFAGNCPAEAQKSVARILSNPAEAATVVRNAQAHLRITSRKTVSRMQALLKKTAKQ